MANFQVPRMTISTKSGLWRTCYSLSGGGYNASLPTVVMINSYATTVDLYAPQFEDAEITSACNLLAVGLLGHELEAKKLSGTDMFTYWDQADLIVDVLDTIGIDKFFMVGTSQGGFIAARVALRVGDRVQGIMSCGSTFLNEVSYPMQFANWCDAFHKPDSSFTVPADYRHWWADMGWGETATKPLLEFWDKTLDDRYSGLDGQRRLWLITVTIFERDTIRYRLADLKCPFWVIHGEKDVAIPASVVDEQFRWLTSVESQDKKIEIIKDGTHYLTQSKPLECKKILLDLLKQYS